MGCLYYDGEGTDVSFEKALHWFCKAAEQNHDLAAARCADMYRKGEGTPVDLKKARFWDEGHTV